MKGEKTVAVVLCTYNGEKYVAEQIESILAQTRQPDEIIIQDDHSTDGTLEIVRGYAARYPFIKVFSNEMPAGVNNNFFSAFSRVKSDYIAVSDQDDIWEPDKLESQMEAIGTNLLCVCRSAPFSEDGRQWHVDRREPNTSLIHCLYYSFPGHTMLFSKELLELIPDPYRDYRSLYDVLLLLAASAAERVTVVNRFLVKQRRHSKAVTFRRQDPRHQRSYGNALYILWWSINNHRRLQAPMRWKFSPHRRLQAPMRWKFSPRFDFVEATGIDSGLTRDALALLRREGTGLRGLPGMMRIHIKYRHELFFTREKGLSNFLRAMLFCVMHCYHCRHYPEDKARWEEQQNQQNKQIS